MANAFNFDQQSAQRIARVVRDAERTAGAGSTPAPARAGTAGTFFAKIIGESAATPGNYSWTTVDRVNGVWVERTPRAFCSSCSAFEQNGAAGVAAKTVVRMELTAATTTAPPTDSSPAPSAAGPDDVDLAVTDAPFPSYMFSQGPPAPRRVTLSKDGGSDGNATTGTYASWTYTVTDYATGATIGKKVAVWATRPLPITTTPATRGLALGGSPLAGSGTGTGGSASGTGDGSAGTVVLLEAYELFGEIDCAAVVTDGAGEASGTGDVTGTGDA